MMHLKPYLIFPGTCKEALTFYATCLGGDIVLLQTYADSPLDVNESHGDRIFNAEVQAGDVAFMASDNLPDQELIAGTNFALFVAFGGAEKQKQVFEALGEGGHVMMPLNEGFGMLEDRYKVRWMLALERD